MLHLYWVTTEDHCEDWFIIAASECEAAALHESLEGYNTGEATAESVIDIPVNTYVEKGWPLEKDLKALGAKFYSTGAARVVEISGRRFSEGLLESVVRTLDDDSFELLGQGRVNATEKGTHH